MLLIERTPMLCKACLSHFGEGPTLIFLMMRDENCGQDFVSEDTTNDDLLAFGKSHFSSLTSR